MLVPLHLRRCNRITPSRPRCIRSNLVAVGPDKLSPRRILASDFRRTETEIRIARTRENGDKKTRIKSLDKDGRKLRNREISRDMKTTERQSIIYMHIQRSLMPL